MIRIVIIIVATLALSVTAWEQAATAWFGKFSPQLALQIRPDHPAALINVSQLAISQKKEAEFKRIARANALTALSQEPLSATALHQLGRYYAKKGEVARGRNLIMLSAALSRRDSASQLWIFEDRLKAGRSLQALQALDVLLRTEDDTRETIFRTFGSLLIDPQFRRVFIQFVGNQPPWMKEFLAFSVGTVSRPEAFAQTLAAMQPFPRRLLSDEQLGIVLVELANKAPISEVRLFYLDIPGTDPKLLTSLAPARGSNAFRFPPVGWELMSDSNGQGFGYFNENTYTIEALALPGRRATIARKVLFLKPGTYRWTGIVDNSGMRDQASAALRMLCNQGIGRWRATAFSPLRSGLNRWDFDVPTGCDAQALVIETVGSESQSDASMSVTKMTLQGI